MPSSSDSQESPSTPSISFAVFFELALVFVALLLGYWTNVRPLERIPSPGDSRGLLLGVGGGAALGVGMVLSFLLISRLQLQWLDNASKQAEEFVRTLLADAGPAQWMALSLAAGIGEEVLFRGWLQTWFIAMLSQFPTVSANAQPIGLILSSLLFGLAHPTSKGYVLVASSAGLILGTAYLWSQNLLLAIIAHAVYDAILLHRYWLSISKKEPLS